MKLRFATPADVPALLEIYGEYIQTPITFEYELPSLAEFAQRVADVQARYPYLVAEEGDKILGYAYAHPERTRAAYQWNAELSVYLRSSAAGQGLGTKLCRALLELLRLQGIRTVYSVVTVPNPASESLHRALGFRLLATHQNTGYKNGGWHDTIWFEKHLNAFDTDPQPIHSVLELPPQTVQAVLDSF